MARFSDDAEYWLENCRGRQQFASRRLAERVANRERRDEAVRYEVYRCPVCKMLHVGSARPRTRLERKGRRGKWRLRYYSGGEG